MVTAQYIRDLLDGNNIDECNEVSKKNCASSIVQMKSFLPSAEKYEQKRQQKQLMQQQKLRCFHMLYHNPHKDSRSVCYWYCVECCGLLVLQKERCE